MKADALRVQSSVSSSSRATASQLVGLCLLVVRFGKVPEHIKAERALMCAPISGGNASLSYGNTLNVCDGMVRGMRIEPKITTPSTLCFLGSCTSSILKMIQIKSGEFVLWHTHNRVRKQQLIYCYEMMYSSGTFCVKRGKGSVMIKEVFAVVPVWQRGLFGLAVTGWLTFMVLGLMP